MPTPWVRANMVMSLDGAAAVGGRVGPLSDPADQRLLHLLRALADVVVVGAGTVRAEDYGPLRLNPELQSVRVGAGLPEQAPPLAVVSASMRFDPAARLFGEGGGPVWLVTSRTNAPKASGLPAEVVVAGDQRVDIHALLNELAGRGHRRVLCEGGPLLLAEFVAADALDELCLTLSPRLAGPQPLSLTEGAAFPIHELRLAQTVTDADFVYLRYRRPDAR